MTGPMMMMLALIGADTDARCPMPVKLDQAPRAMINNENTAKQIAGIT